MLDPSWTNRRPHHNPQICLSIQGGPATPRLGTSWFPEQGPSDLVAWRPVILGFSHLDLSSQKCSKDNPLGQDTWKGTAISLRFPGALWWVTGLGGLPYGPEVQNWDV